MTTPSVMVFGVCRASIDFAAQLGPMANGFPFSLEQTIVIVIVFFLGVGIGSVFLLQRYFALKRRFLASKLEALDEGIDSGLKPSEADERLPMPKESTPANAKAAQTHTEEADEPPPPPPTPVPEAPTGELTNRIYSILGSIDNQETDTQGIFKRVLLYTRANLDQSISVAELAQQMHVSPRTLQRTLKETLRSSPKDIVNAIKMHEAKRMLNSGKHLVSEVAYAVGFETPSHFSRKFKLQYGIAPKKLVDAAKKKLIRN